LAWSLEQLQTCSAMSRTIGRAGAMPSRQIHTATVGASHVEPMRLAPDDQVLPRDISCPSFTPDLTRADRVGLRRLTIEYRQPRSFRLHSAFRPIRHAKSPGTTQEPTGAGCHQWPQNDGTRTCNSVPQALVAGWLLHVENDSPPSPSPLWVRNNSNTPIEIRPVKVPHIRPFTPTAATTRRATAGPPGRARPALGWQECLSVGANTSPGSTNRSYTSA